MPPRCCRIPVPDVLVIPHLSPKSAALFLAKCREHKTSNRLYCPGATCSEFLGSAQDERLDIRCHKCSKLVCAACKSFAHPLDIPCKLETDSQEVLDLAETEGWKRCPGCSHMVELGLGCYHMTCLCRTEFCYVCRAPWKTCTCPQWDEGRLMAAAEHQIENQVENRIAYEPNFVVRDRERLVLRAAERLRNNHECQHPGWTLLQGGSQCESCHNFLDRYILVSAVSTVRVSAKFGIQCCNSCQMRACVRCQRNRL